MTQEEKQLLLQDLCARLPYGVMIQIPELFYPQRKVIEKLVAIDELHFNDSGTYIEYVKPYLRPMSSMTDEEDKKRIQLSILLAINSNHERIFDGFGNESVDTQLKALDWLNAHHFDFRGLIEKGLALEAPEGMYK